MAFWQYICIASNCDYDDPVIHRGATPGPSPGFQSDQVCLTDVWIGFPILAVELGFEGTAGEGTIDTKRKSGYTLARMRYEIVFAPEAVADFKRLSARNRSIVRDAIETHLRYEPQKVSKSRIKQLRGVRRPQYRLRVSEVRIFYDVTDQVVEVLAIVPKSNAATWLDKMGEPE
jgi:mRNA interferase RelE/StbE